ncbi:MAG: hypothetical protein ABW007_19485 [Chitinophagaceae bacterium]
MNAEILARYRKQLKAGKGVIVWLPTVKKHLHVVPISTFQVESGEDSRLMVAVGASDISLSGGLCYYNPDAPFLSPSEMALEPHRLPIRDVASIFWFLTLMFFPVKTNKKYQPKTPVERWIERCEGCRKKYTKRKKEKKTKSSKPAKHKSEKLKKSKAIDTHEKTYTRQHSAESRRSSAIDIEAC